MLTKNLTPTCEFRWALKNKMNFARDESFPTTVLQQKWIVVGSSKSDQEEVWQELPFVDVRNNR